MNFSSINNFLERTTPNGESTGVNSGATNRKRGGKIGLWTERALLVIGFALLATYGASRIEGLLNSRAALKNFSAPNASAASAGGNLLENIPSSSVDFSRWDVRRVRAYLESFSKPSNSPLAVLSIPKIQLQVPVLEGTDDLTLNHAVGRIAGTAQPGEQGNIGIAGHRDGFFRGLKGVVVGDAIELKTRTGTDSYVVDEIKIVTPNNVDVLLPRSRPSLTLVTCYPFYFIGSAPKRYIVTASLSREIKSGSENQIFQPLSQTSNSKRRNNEQIQ